MKGHPSTGTQTDNLIIAAINLSGNVKLISNVSALGLRLRMRRLLHLYVTNWPLPTFYEFVKEAFTLRWQRQFLLFIMLLPRKLFHFFPPYSFVVSTIHNIKTMNIKSLPFQSLTNFCRKRQTKVSVS